VPGKAFDDSVLHVHDQQRVSHNLASFVFGHNTLIYSGDDD
jgi:hypothetical protein